MNQETRRMLRRLRRSLFRGRGSWRKAIKAWWRFWISYGRYRTMAPPDRRPLLKDLYPCLGDDSGETQVEPVYFYQDAWAFEKIVKTRPPFHVDVGSHHKFVSLLSKVVPVVMVDIRPLALPMDSLKFQMGSITDLPFADSSLPSISSLCVVEHIGLGRYGDPLDPYGSEKAIKELKRVVQPGGDLYISVPLDDKNRIYFNAHRAFREEYLLTLFEPFQVVESRYIYGRTFGEQRKSGFGTGCYHLKHLEG